MSRALIASLAAWLITGTTLAQAADDLTRPYLSAYYDNCAFGTAHAQTLRAYRVLLLPGYLGDLYPDYFNDHLQWLASLGVEHQKLPIRSGDRSTINGPIIAAAIRQSAKPVILITHSKGSVDALEALLTDAGLRAKVKGWLSLQGTFFGSPVADKLLDGSLINPLVASVILGFLGGTRESALDLTTGAAQAYYRKHAAAIGTLLREVPAIAFASAVDNTRSEQPSTALEIPHELMAREGIRSDGLVPLDAATLPGMDFVKVTGVDHIAPVMPSRQPFNRVRMTQALLLMLGAPWRAVCRAMRGVSRGDEANRFAAPAGHAYPHFLRTAHPQTQSPAMCSRGFAGLPLHVAQDCHVTVTQAGRLLPARVGYGRSRHR